MSGWAGSPVCLRRRTHRRRVAVAVQLAERCRHYWTPLGLRSVRSGADGACFRGLGQQGLHRVWIHIDDYPDTIGQGDATLRPTSDCLNGNDRFQLDVNRSPRRAVRASRQCVGPECAGVSGASDPHGLDWMVSCCFLGLPQFVMRQTLADQPASERCHLVARIQIPLVRPTRDLPEIAREVLHRDLVVRAVIAALEQGPEGFDPVRMHGSPHVFASLVLHSFVLVSLQTLVRRMLIGVHGGSRLGALVAFLAAEIGLVDFDRPSGRVLPLDPSLANAYWQRARRRLGGCRGRAAVPCSRRP